MNQHLLRISLAVLLVAGCGGAAPATTAPATPLPVASGPTTSTPAIPVPATSEPTAVPPTAEPPTAGPAESAPPVPGTVVPGSSLDPSLSDAGVVGRLTIDSDTRGNRTGTHEIIGLAEDGSTCSFSFDGDEFTALAWYDAAPDGMLHQMAVTIPTDTVPVNDGELRMAIPDGRIYADFVSEGGYGTAYSGDSTEPDSGTVKIDAARAGDTLTLSFNGTTWDAIDFSGQMMCSGLDDDS